MHFVQRWMQIISRRAAAITSHCSSRRSRLFFIHFISFHYTKYQYLFSPFTNCNRFVCLFVCLFFPMSCSTGLVCQLLPDFLFLTYDKVIRIQWKNFIFELQYFLYFSSNICLAECLCVQCTLYICESSTEF